MNMIDNHDEKNGLGEYVSPVIAVSKDGEAKDANPLNEENAVVGDNVNSTFYKLNEDPDVYYQVASQCWGVQNRNLYPTAGGIVEPNDMYWQPAPLPQEAAELQLKGYIELHTLMNTHQENLYYKEEVNRIEESRLELKRKSKALEAIETELQDISVECYEGKLRLLIRNAEEGVMAYKTLIEEELKFATIFTCLERGNNEILYVRFATLSGDLEIFLDLEKLHSKRTIFSVLKSNKLHVNVPRGLSQEVESELISYLRSNAEVVEIPFEPGFFVDSSGKLTLVKNADMTMGKLLKEMEKCAKR